MPVPDPPVPTPPWRTNGWGFATDNVTDGGELFRRLRGDGSPKAVAGGVEAFAGFVTLLLVLLGGGLLGGGILFNAWVYHYPRMDRAPLLGWTVLWAVALPLCCRSIGFFLQALGDAGPPVPVSVARRWLDTPAAARPLVGGWWLLLSVVTLAACHYVAGHVSFFRPTAVERVVEYAVPAAFLYGSAFAVNTNLLIAVAALTGSDDAVRQAHRLRLVLDLLAVTLFLTIRLPLVP